MKITSANYYNIDESYFYKATQGGIQLCVKISNFGVGSSYDDEFYGYVVDSLFVRIRYSNGNPNQVDISHFDQPHQGFFTSEEEAIELHRELVLNYINGLNASSLKTCPIVTG